MLNMRYNVNITLRKVLGGCMEQENTIISIQNLKKSFKNISVLQNINLNIKRGTVFALLGSNGAGKTTIVNILSTLMSYDEGNITICGYDLRKQEKEICKCISLTGQYAAVDELLSGRENLRMMATLCHLKSRDHKVEELISYFQLDDAAQRLVKTYSGGMRRRLDIAMSLLSDPAIIFLDEPTTGLDPQNRIAMWEIVKSLVKKGTTVFLTTQYLEEAEQLADHIAILDGGVIVAQGTTEELKKQLPQGIVEITFQDAAHMAAAKLLYRDYHIQEQQECMTISIETDGSIQEMSDILNKLLKEQLVVSGFKQKLPTLEDVFLNLIQNKEEA